MRHRASSAAPPRARGPPSRGRPAPRVSTAAPAAVEGRRARRGARRARRRCRPSARSSNAADAAPALPVAFNRASPFAAACRTTASSLVRRSISAARRRRGRWRPARSGPRNDPLIVSLQHRHQPRLRLAPRQSPSAVASAARTDQCGSGSRPEMALMKRIGVDRAPARREPPRAASATTPSASSSNASTAAGRAGRARPPPPSAASDRRHARCIFSSVSARPRGGRSSPATVPPAMRTAVRLRGVGGDVAAAPARGACFSTPRPRAANARVHLPLAREQQR